MLSGVFAVLDDLCVRAFVYMCGCSSAFLYMCLSVCLSVFLNVSVCLSACVSVYMYVSVCLSVCTYVWNKYRLLHPQGPPRVGDGDWRVTKA